MKRRIENTAQLCEALEIAFSDEQLEAICAPMAPGVIIAGAGSGKTTVMAARVVWLVGTGQVLPEQVLGLTFTRKAAAELATRIRDALVRAGVIDPEEDEGQEVVMTYDAFAARLIAEHGLRLGLETDPRIITGASRYRLAARVVANAPGPFEALSRLRPNALAERLLKLDSDLQSHLVLPDEIDKHAQQLKRELAAAPRNRLGNVFASIKRAVAAVDERVELAMLVRDYQQLKRELGVVEFADQLAAAARLVSSSQTVPNLLRSQFRIVLLDEYQDTSSAQAKLLRDLFGDGHPVTAVGDPFQAIYGWRGAASTNITSFATDFPGVDGPAAHFSLSVNRRSHQQILDVANQLGENLRQQQASIGVGVEVLKAPPLKEEGRVFAAGFESDEAEVRWVADTIAGAADELKWAEIAILVRRNRDIPALYSALVERDVPVEIVGLGGLLFLPEVAHVVATLALLDDFTSNPDLVSLLSGPRWRIGPGDLAALGRRARELAPRHFSDSDIDSALQAAIERTDPTEAICLFDAVLDPGEGLISTDGRERLRRFAVEFAGLQRHASEPVADLARRVIATLGLEVELLAEHSSARLHDPIAQLAAFQQAVADYVDVDGDASLSGLLAYLQAEADHGVGLDMATPSERNSVKLMTVHKAKGLEWEWVFLPGLADKVFPSDRVSDNYLKAAEAIPAPLRGDRGSIPQLSEATDKGLSAYAEALSAEQLLAEDRLGYVAVTRAKRVLFGSWHVWGSGLANPRKPSAYFEAIRQEAARQGNVLAVAPTPNSEKRPAALDEPAAWPAQLDDSALQRRLEAVRWVQEAMAGPVAAEPLSAEAAKLVEDWDSQINLLVAEAESRARPEVQVGTSLSVTSLLGLKRDAQAWALQAIRPMPRPPSPAADLGARFHDWVQSRFGAQTLFDDAPMDQALARLCTAFEKGPYADRVPIATEAPFLLNLGDRVVRGRIDAVYETSGDYDYELVDWKTGAGVADPLQLGIYRLAWARARGLDPARVDAVFYYVLSGEVQRAGAVPSEEDLLGQLLG